MQLHEPALYMAQYRSGHNGMALKAIVLACIQPVGSNPTCVAIVGLVFSPQLLSLYLNW